MDINSVFLKATENHGIMDFTMNLIDNGRGIPATQAAALAAMGGSVTAYQTTNQATHQTHQSTHSHQSQSESSANHHPQAAHMIAIGPHQQSHQLSLLSNHHQHYQQHNQMLNDDDESVIMQDTKPQILTKDEVESVVAFTPPPRVASVSSIASHSDARIEKDTDSSDEPFIKVEIRGHIPGITNGDKDKNNILLLHFNSINEVMAYFSQRTPPQLGDAFNFFTNPELVRNMNPELVRNLIYVPTGQDGVRIPGSSMLMNANSLNQVSNGVQPPNSSPMLITNESLASAAASAVQAQIAGVKPRVKPQRRRGEVPPGTIINKTPPIEVNPNQFVCWICGVNLQKSLPFEEHMVEQHSVEKPYKCDDCGVTFKQKAHIDRHRRIHLPTRPYQCGICGKGFTRNEHVRRHAFTHSGEKPFHCPTCSKMFSRQQQLTKHLHTHTKPPRADSPQLGHPHSGLATTLLLQTTDQNGRLVTINQAGQAVTINQDGQAVTINQSGQTVTLPSSLVVNQSVGPIISQTSNHAATITSPGSTRGRQANGEPVARPFQCGVCSKAFIRNEHLRRHMLIHSGEKPHACDICGKAFPRREHLSKHKRSHNKDNNQHQSAIQNSVPNTVSVSSITQQVTLPASANAVSNNGLNGITIVPSSHQTSHNGPHGVQSSAHLPSGGHYLPMFGGVMAAEVM